MPRAGRAASPWGAVLILLVLGSGAAVAAPQETLRIRLISPTADDLVAGRVEMRADVEAGQPDSVLFVEFEVDGRVLFADSQPPYELIWHPRRPGSYRIVARVFDRAGNLAEHVVQTAAPPQALLDGSVFSARSERVELYAHLDEDGLDRSLAADDFVVLEDGVAQPILELRRSSELPVAIGFMVDASGSMVERLDYALETAGAFIDGLMERGHDKAFVMSFSDLPSMLTQFTNDSDRLSQSLRLISNGKYTRLYDALISAAREFEGHTGRRAIVVLTDGHDANSNARLGEAVRAAQQADLAIYPVAIDVSPRFFHERWVLRRLAEQTGGRLFYLQNRDDPARIYEQIAADLRQQYRVTYSPLDPGGDGEWRSIEVRVADQRGRSQRVRTRPGYFAR